MKRCVSHFVIFSAIALTALGCSSASTDAGSQPLVSRLWISTSTKPTDSETEFPRDQKITLLGHFELTQPSPGTKLMGSWLAQKALGLPKNTSVGQSTITLGASEKGGTFTATSPAGGFKHGFYELDVFVNGVKKKTLYFKIV